MLNIAIQRILQSLSNGCSFLITALVIGSILGMIATLNDAMGQPFNEFRSENYLYRISDSAAVAITPNGECPEGTVQAAQPLDPQLGCIPNNETLEPNGEP